MFSLICAVSAHTKNGWDDGKFHCEMALRWSAYDAVDGSSTGT
jgi:hypothetical protein